MFHFVASYTQGCLHFRGRNSTLLHLKLRIPIIIAEFVLLIGSLDRSGLYCNSKNYLDSIFNATPYCIISGIKRNSIITRRADINFAWDNFWSGRPIFRQPLSFMSLYCVVYNSPSI